MNRNYRAAVSAVALLGAVQSNLPAATQQVVLPAYSGGDYDILFPTTVFGADDLVSISPGPTVFTGEFGTLTISAIDTNNNTFQLYSVFFPPSFFETKALDFYTNNNFTALPAPTDIVGLRISSPGGAPEASLTIPAATILTFSVVPEPTTALLVLFSLFLLPVLWRWKFRPVAVQARF